MADAKSTPLGPVALIYNMDSTWPKADQQNARRLLRHMLAGLRELQVEVHPVEIHRDLEELSRFDPEETLVFNWCEGFEDMPWSDAFVARELEARGFVFTGASSRALRKSTNKDVTKRMLFEAGVSTPPGRSLHHDQAKDWHVYPAMVKPVGQHCSFGVSRASVVESQAELVRQICRIEEEFDEKALVEPFIGGREFHVGVWGNRKPEALPLVELDYSEFPQSMTRIYTFSSKFDPTSEGWNSINWLCPAPVEEGLRRAIEEVAIMAYRATHCRDYARMDIRLWNGTPMVLDVNPNADLDPDSVVPMAAEAAGYSYGQMAYRILEFAAARLRRRNASRQRRQRKAMEVV